ncbi:glycosyl transferase family 2 [Desulfofarcimen acetoxidans DSM 771]|uniref:Glycosyl transferase family 2 n=1 Tax=Desulfofarcimen acetoxidans (strain ATCC 49208 / DSM 771 / KCTC 5769 / VKM B-1644 / 5575) TaxID=485916 RepID=C8W006_DESAS|nr:glycosyltransferase family 2 protein [Desulfofarcimen acetoxidans]ACV64974.1 glycosyl transferase family 2 [Desulfofarcimen acetoxidans DSM 771]
MNPIVTYSIVVPVFNEEAVIAVTYERLKKVMDTTGESYELLFVNDGSSDQTAEIIDRICRQDDHVKLINFSRNFGHQIAISAGMDNALGQAVVVIDADLQDPPEVIWQMIERWKKGYEVVYATRKERKGETLFKKWTAAAFYRLLKFITDIDIPVDTGDFRLIDRKVCNVMKNLKEKNRFVRGLVSWVGFRQTAVEYVREERFAGESKYPLRKMIKLSLDAITTFSYKPLKLAVCLGFVFSSLSLVYLFFALLERLIGTYTLPAWALLIAMGIFLNGIILSVLGIIGEYIGRIYDESKGRPLYIIANKAGFGREEESHEY